MATLAASLSVMADVAFAVEMLIFCPLALLIEILPVKFSVGSVTRSPSMFTGIFSVVDPAGMV